MKSTAFKNSFFLNLLQQALFIMIFAALSSCSSVSTRKGEKEYAPGQDTSRIKSIQDVNLPYEESISKSFSPQVSEEQLKQAEKSAATFPAQNFEKTGQWVNAFLSWTKLYLNELKATGKSNDVYLTKALNILHSHIGLEDLLNMRDDDLGILTAHINFRLGEIYLRQNESSSAIRFFEKTAEIAPESEIGKQAKLIYQDIYALRSVSPQTVGVVLPLTGKSANVAKRALRGIELGLGMHLPGSTFKIAVVDSEGNPEAARRGVERLAKEDNPIAIIGSLLSRNASAVATKANELGIPNISLSQKSNITEIGQYVFSNSLTSEIQISELVRVAMEDLGMRKFAVLYPNDSYGAESANIFWDQVLARGGQITAAQTYSPRETDFREPIQRMIGTFFVEARLTEYKSIKEAQEKASPTKSARTRDKEQSLVLSPIIDFDAIFIPDNIKSAGQIAAMLSYNDVKNVKILGTNLFNNPELPRRLGNWASNSIFIDGYLKSDKNLFVATYKAMYGEDPTLLEAQAYDAAYVLRALIANGVTSRSRMAEALTQVRNFPAAIGNISTSDDREFLRPTFVLTVENGKIVPFRPQIN